MRGECDRDVKGVSYSKSSVVLQCSLSENEVNHVVKNYCCLLLIDKTRAKNKTYK